MSHVHTKTSYSFCMPINIKKQAFTKRSFSKKDISVTHRTMIINLLQSTTRLSWIFYQAWFGRKGAKLAATYLQFWLKRLQEHCDPSQQTSFPLGRLGHVMSLLKQKRPRLKAKKRMSTILISLLRMPQQRIPLSFSWKDFHILTNMLRDTKVCTKEFWTICWRLSPPLWDFTIPINKKTISTPRQCEKITTEI